MDTVEVCCSPGCTNEARAAVVTARPHRDSLTTKVWWDNRDPSVPKKALRYCKTHTCELLGTIGSTLIHDDEEAQSAHVPS